jgi:hypothetical protein
MPAEKQADQPYSKSFAPMANVIRAVRTLAVTQGWHKRDEQWWVEDLQSWSHLGDGLMLPELRELAEADAQLRDALIDIAKADPKFRDICDRGRLLI